MAFHTTSGLPLVLQTLPGKHSSVHLYSTLAPQIQNKNQGLTLAAQTLSVLRTKSTNLDLTSTPQTSPDRPNSAYLRRTQNSRAFQIDAVPPIFA